jgi:lipoprotein-anchoring transpeptidase ErfK/SrfK
MIVACLVATLVGTGCAASSSNPSAIPAPDKPPPTAYTPKHQPVAIAVQPANGATGVRPDTGLLVTAKHGRLTGLTVNGTVGDQPLSVGGTLAPDGSSWSAPPSLVPSATYTVTATAVGEDSVPAQSTTTFSTLRPSRPLKTKVVPTAGEVVGVGMPIQVMLTQPVAPERRAAVQQRLTVTTSVPVEGAWNWNSDTQVIWRPKEFWPANTNVSLGISLAGLEAGADTWGVENRTVDITIGRSVISTVDVASHHMTVYIDGVHARTIPVTTGKPGFFTRGGTKLITGKVPSIRMNAESIGIRPGDPEYYDLQVRYAMRLTNSGEFLHAAPWSVGSHGRANVSHGCTGMSTANAAWLYSIAQRGDPVHYVNAGRGPAEPGNGWTYWEVPWDQWVAGSAA